jgi:hypothetical protein
MTSITADTAATIIPRQRARTLDPRIPFAAILALYAILGCTVLRFNRTPVQMLVTIASTCALDVFFCRVIHRRWLVPLSAFITGTSLALLLNYSHNSFVLFLPVFLAIGSKYVLTFEGRHVFNPSMFGVAVSLLIGGDLIGTAPAYQWGGMYFGTVAMSAFLVAAALFLFIFRVGRTPLVVSFLLFYTLQILLRAYLMRWYLPPESLILGTLTSAPFFLFVFYMITDPKTSPGGARAQVALAFALTVVDLFFHTRGSVYTFFYAALVVSAARFVYLHARRMVARLLGSPVAGQLGNPATRQLLLAWTLVATTGAIGYATYATIIHPRVVPPPLTFALVPLSPAQTGVAPVMDGSVIAQVDPRVQHIAKWVLSAGDAASVGDFDNDGLLDLFICGPFKTQRDRAILYRNLGGFRFERVSVPAIDRILADPKSFGIISSGVFADIDNDGYEDLILTVGYGRTVILRNDHGVFTDVSSTSGANDYTISVAANLLDIDGDGKLDLIVANALNPWLEQYSPPRPLSIFNLWKPEYPGDRRMLPFMHSSWDNARNGGLNLLYRNVSPCHPERAKRVEEPPGKDDRPSSALQAPSPRKRGEGELPGLLPLAPRERGEGGQRPGEGPPIRFQKLNSAAAGLPETHWSLAIATGDLNHDGRPDLYIANDFGPDDLYLNEGGGKFVKIEGKIVGEISHDTYKGMNASMGDIDRNGYLDIYVSNVHVPLQAEGSLLWMTYPAKDAFVPEFRDEATQRGALNEHRFGWGGAMGDLDNDGWLDILQANGMIDDRFDRKFAQCRDYWYVNEKLMRSGPEIHTYADMWGDLRGYCINGHESNRVYLSRGDVDKLQFVDVASQLGWKEEPPSRGMLLADFDNDGALDVAVTHITAPITIYRNTRNDRGDAHWIGFDLHGNGTTCNRDAAGSTVTISYIENGKRVSQMREISIQNAFAAQGDRRALFGLGKYAGQVDVEVKWNNGGVTRMRVPPNKYVRVQQEEVTGHRSQVIGGGGL